MFPPKRSKYGHVPLHHLSLLKTLQVDLCGIELNGVSFPSLFLRYGAGGNKSAHTTTALSAKKLEEADDVGTIARVDRSLSKAIMQARTAKKMTQKELATAINEKPQVVGQYESGKAIPNPQIIGKLERKLGCKLPRPGKSKTAPTAGATAAAKKPGVTRGGPPKRR